MYELMNELERMVLLESLYGPRIYDLPGIKMDIYYKKWGKWSSRYYVNA